MLYFYRQLDEQQRVELFEAFSRANWWWLLLSILFGWMSHMSRAWRWRYLLDSMGYRPGFWNCYHATMSGYFMNLLIQRAGEASRAALLYRREKVPFVKGFGSIVAERAVDMITPHRTIRTHRALTVGQTGPVPRADRSFSGRSGAW